jgi:hypothetical protein
LSLLVVAAVHSLGLVALAVLVVLGLELLLQ